MLWLLFVEFFISAMPTRFSSNDFRGQVSLFCVCECVSVWVCECVCVCEGYGTLPGGAPARFPVAGDFPTKRWCRDWFNFRRLGAKIDSIHRLTLNWYICMYIFLKNGWWQLSFVWTYSHAMGNIHRLWGSLAWRVVSRASHTWLDRSNKYGDKIRVWIPCLDHNHRSSSNSAIITDWFA